MNCRIRSWRHTWRIVAAAFAIALCGTTLSTLHQSAQAKSARYSNFDVSLTLRDDGSYHVVETQEVTFEGGSFSLGHRDIPTDRMTGIEGVRVSEKTKTGTVMYHRVDLADLPNDAHTFSVLNTSGELTLYWNFSPATDESKTFVVEYDVDGALRVYADHDPPREQIWWSAFGSELTKETPVDAASMTVTLPQAVALDDVLLGEDGKEKPADHSTDGRVFTWSQQEFHSGDDYTVRLEFPNMVNASAPAWQATDDERRAQAEKAKQHDAEMTLTLLAAGLLLATGGGAGAYGVWYTRGRDPHTGLVADFLPAPPSDLPAGVAGTLLDEKADEHDVIATVFDLGRQGVLKVTDVGLLGPAKKATHTDYIIEVVNPDLPMRRLDRTVLGAIFGSASPKTGDKTSMREAGPRIVERGPEIKEELYRELIYRDYFMRSPEETRDGWRRAGYAIAISSILFGIIGVVAFNWMALFPAAVILILGIVLIRLSRAMPRKTAAGAEEAAKWKAFRRYLSDLDKYEQISESKAIIERYISYAIAFECESLWVARYHDIGRSSFDWLDVFGNGAGYPRPTTVHGSGGSGHVGVPDVDLPDVDMPDIQSMSNKASSGIQRGSDDLSTVFNVVGVLLQVVAAFAGGGSSGGSSGGGGGGFK